MRNAYRLVFSPKMTREVSTVLATGPADIARIMTPYADASPVECVWVVMLNAQRRVIGERPVEITRGLLSSSLIHAREVFSAAILANASSIVLCHNHPSGILVPSVEDAQVTADLVSAGKILDIPLNDHIIMGLNGEYFSFAEKGMI